jgi:peptide/nickel transport system permease protein
VLSFAGRRLLAVVPRLVGVVLVVVVLTELMPGDPAVIMAGDGATPEAIAAVRAQLHLDRPVWERLADYVGGVLHGDLGTSPGTAQPITERIGAALPVTLSLVLVTMVIAIVLGVGFGAAAALRRGRFLDRAVITGSSVLLAVPAFVVGLFLVLELAVARPWLPAGGFAPLSAGPGAWLAHLVLPGLALALVGAAELARQTRGAVLDVLGRDFVRAARARGIAERYVLGKHAAKSSASPVVTVTGLQVAGILGGTIVVERIFGMHGLGSLAVDAVLRRDVLLLQGIVLVVAVGVLVINLLVDLSYGYFDPRVRT